MFRVIPQSRWPLRLRAQATGHALVLVWCDKTIKTIRIYRENSTIMNSPIPTIMYYANEATGTSLISTNCGHISVSCGGGGESGAVRAFIVHCYEIRRLRAEAPQERPTIISRKHIPCID